MTGALKGRGAAVLAGALALFTLYTIAAGATEVGAAESLAAAVAFAVAFGGYLLIGRWTGGRPALGLVVPAAAIAAVSFIVFHQSSTNIFRSDEWIILVRFHEISGLSLRTLREITLFEMFGDLRFQPLAHMIIFARHALFGDSILLHHALNILMHAGAAFSLLLFIRSVTGDLRFSYLFALIYVVLPSQFDTVVWTYHTYIILGVAFYLLAASFSVNFAWAPTGTRITLAAVLATLSVLLYEPALLAPLSLFFIVLGLRTRGAGAFDRRSLVLAVVAVAASYAVYASVTLYGLSLIKGARKVHLSDLGGATVLYLGIKTVFINLFKTTFLKNIGMPLFVNIGDIVYLDLKEHFYWSFTSVVKIASALFLLSFARLRKKDLLIILTLAGVGLSYFAVISIGRMITNNPYYVMTQPRYQYFLNAAMLSMLAILLWRKFSGNGRRAVTVLLAAFFFWNAQNTIYADGRVAETMGPVSDQYYAVKGFLDENPGATVFVNVKHEEYEFYLGRDVSMDLLLEEGTTRRMDRADFIYDGNSFARNPYRRAPGDDERLGDFTVEWRQWYLRGRPHSKDVSVVGRNGEYPKITVTSDEHVRLEIVEQSTGRIQAYAFRLPYPYVPEFNDFGGWNDITVEKDGSTLCLFFNGRMLGSTRLDGEFEPFKNDGADLLGDFYQGAGELFYAANLFIEIGASRYGCTP